METLFFALFIVAGLAFTYYGWSFKRKVAASASWPSTEGTVTSIEFDDDSTPDSTTIYQTNVTYTYKVRGVQYESSRIAFGYSASRSRETELSLFSSLKDAQSVTVRYNPSRPSEATLDCWQGEPRGSALMNFGLLWVFATIVLMLLSAFST